MPAPYIWPVRLKCARPFSGWDLLLYNQPAQRAFQPTRHAPLPPDGDNLGALDEWLSASAEGFGRWREQCVAERSLRQSAEWPLCLPKGDVICNRSTSQLRHDRTFAPL